MFPSLFQHHHIKVWFVFDENKSLSVSSWWCLVCTDCILCRWVITPPLLGRTLNFIWLWGSISRAFGSVENPFIAITPWSILTQSGSTCMDQIDLSLEVGVTTSIPTPMTVLNMTKPSDGEASVLELLRVCSTFSLPSLLGPFWRGVVVPIKVPSMELFNHLLYLKPFNCVQTNDC